MTNSKYKFYIGIDISKSKLDVAANDDESISQFSNDEQGVKDLIKALPSKKKTLIVMEASGGYEKFVANHLRQKKFNIAIVNASRVRNFAKASGKSAKTDKIDANVIRDFGRAFNPIPQALPTTEEQESLQNINRRAQLVKIIALEKQHREQASSKHKKRIDKHIQFLEKELEEMDELLRKQVSADPIMCDKVERLDEIKGVGETIAMTVLLHMPELGKLTHREVSALAGVAPFNKDSGQMKGKRQTWGGRAVVRSALYMAVLTAKKFNPVIKRFYDELVGRGKLKMVAIVACMRKLLIIMNAMMRDNTRWVSTR
jgi:transposase